MDELRRRYAALVKLYPPSFRREHGEALLATSLDAAPPGARRPPVGDVVDLVRGAARAYLRPVHTPAARRTRRDGVALAADLGLAVHAGFAVAYAYRFGVRDDTLHHGARTAATVRVSVLLACVLLAGALAALVSGRRRLAAGLDGAGLAVALAGRAWFAGAATLPVSAQRLGLAAGVAGVPLLAMVRSRHEGRRAGVASLVLVAALVAAGGLLRDSGGAAVLTAVAVAAATVAVLTAPWRPHRIVATATLLSSMLLAGVGTYLDVVRGGIAGAFTFEEAFGHWWVGVPLAAAAGTAVLTFPLLALFADEQEPPPAAAAGAAGPAGSPGEP